MCWFHNPHYTPYPINRGRLWWSDIRSNFGPNLKHISLLTRLIIRLETGIESSTTPPRCCDAALDQKKKRHTSVFGKAKDWNFICKFRRSPHLAFSATLSQTYLNHCNKSSRYSRTRLDESRDLCLFAKTALRAGLHRLPLLWLIWRPGCIHTRHGNSVWVTGAVTSARKSDERNLIHKAMGGVRIGSWKRGAMTASYLGKQPSTQISRFQGGARGPGNKAVDTLVDADGTSVVNNSLPQSFGTR